MAKVLDEQRYNNYTSIWELVSVIIYLIDLFWFVYFPPILVLKCVRETQILTASLIKLCQEMCPVFQMCPTSIHTDSFPNTKLYSSHTLYPGSIVQTTIQKLAWFHQ